MTGGRSLSRTKASTANAKRKATAQCGMNAQEWKHLVLLCCSSGEAGCRRNLNSNSSQGSGQASDMDDNNAQGGNPVLSIRVFIDGHKDAECPTRRDRHSHRLTSQNTDATTTAKSLDVDSLTLCCWFQRAAAAAAASGLEPPATTRAAPP